MKFDVTFELSFYHSNMRAISHEKNMRTIRNAKQPVSIINFQDAEIEGCESQ